jgi:mevalonate kinase
VARVAAISEELMHGRASGVDVALAIHGGIGVYRKSSGLAPFRCAPLRVLVGSSAEPRSTSAMIERIAAATGGARDDARLHELGALTDRGTIALKAGKLDELGAAMNRAHELLAGLGVSTERLDELCGTARYTGAHGAKLTGAGGGGAVIAIAPPAAEAAILAAWKQLGVTGFVATVGG